MTKTKIIIVLIDGVGDRGLDQFSQQTPLQYHNFTNFNILSRFGKNGLMDPVKPGLAPGSDTAHMSLFGYSPLKYYRGRGSFETLGAGLTMEKGDIAFKSNFATLNTKTGIVEKRRADRKFEHLGPILCKYLEDNIKFKYLDKNWNNKTKKNNKTKQEKEEEEEFQKQYQIKIKYATEHRCGVRIRGPNLSSYITGTDPLKDNLKLVNCSETKLPDIGTPASETIKNRNKEIMNAKFTSHLINKLSIEINELLEKHEINKKRIKDGKNSANVVLLRGAGVRLQVPTFEKLHPELGKPFIIAPTCIIKGVGITFGIDIINVKGATGDYFSDYEAKRRDCVKNILSNKYDFGFLHIKGIDDAGHEKDVEVRISLLKKVNTMIGNLIKDLKNEMKIRESQNKEKVNFSIVLTADHSTPLVFGDHSQDPVPFTVCNVSNIPDSFIFKNNEKEKNNDELLLCKYDKVLKFDEISCSKGCLGRFSGANLMTIVKKEKEFFS